MKINRLLGILTTLLQNDRVTAQKLAEKFEVSTRTIGRDIDILCQAGIPVITYQGVGGGISIAKAFRLDKSVLTVDELLGIIAGLKGIGSVSERSQIELTLDKLGANTNTVVSMGKPVVIDLASHYKEELSKKIDLIKQAILSSRLIKFNYYYEKGKSHRSIEPYFLTFNWDSWYVFGFCLKRQDWRLFKLVRLWDLYLSDESYTLREIPQEKKDLNIWYTDDIKLIAIFDASQKYKLIETYGIHCYTETAEGLRLEVTFTNYDYLLSWLLSFGSMVKVLEPISIKEDIRIVAKNILSLYE